jgi:ferrous iron transport protein B
MLGAAVVAWLLKRFTAAGRQTRPLMMELPNYHLPSPRNIFLGLQQRAEVFLKRVGGIIMALTIAMWFLASFPTPPAEAKVSAIEYSLAGRAGKALAHVFEPIGFNWQISVSLVPGLAAREVIVSALGTVYALSDAQTGMDATAANLGPVIAQTWSIATGLSLLAWFVFAPQCVATLAAVKRETGGWKMPIVMTAYLFALAYLAALIVYRSALWFGLG